MRDITHIVMHCTATPASMDIGVAEVRQWHLNKGWSDVGYHYIIRRNGQVETGRREEKSGAHVAGFNKNSLGISLAGGVAADRNTPEDNFSMVQLDAAHVLVKELMEVYGVPVENVMGHKEVIAQITHGSPKACPVYSMDDFRTAISVPEEDEEDLDGGLIGDEIDPTWPGGE